MDAGQLTVAVVLAWQLGGPERSALVQACTRAFAVGTCTLAAESGSPAESGGAAGAAEVEESSPLHAHVQQGADHRVLLRVREGEGGEQIERSLGFLPEDTPLEQAKAVGLTLGVLAGELQRRAPVRAGDVVAAPSPPSSEPRSPPANGMPTTATDRRGADAPQGFTTLQVGAGWDPGLEANEIGGVLRGAWRLAASRWRVGAVVDAWRVGAFADRVRLGKAHVAVWGGWVHPVATDMELTFGIDMGVQALWATTAAPLAADRAERVVPVLRATGTAVYWAGDAWGIALTAQGTWVGSRTRLLLQDRQVASTGRFGVGMVVGPALRWDFGAPGGR